MFYDFIRGQYRLGMLTKEQVLEKAPKFITEEQAKKIVGVSV